MTFPTVLSAAAITACLALGGCVAPTAVEDAALVGARPTGLAPTVLSPAPTTVAFPSLSGDILGGTSPEILARARAAQAEALTRALAKP